MPKSVIKLASRLYRRKKFPEVIRTLESQIFRFRDNVEFYFLLGSSCLYSSDYGGAVSYLKRAEQLRPQDSHILLGLAAVHLKRAETEEALKKWLKIIDLEPKNRIARKGLNLIRKGISTEDIAELTDSGKLKTLFPPVPPNPSRLLIPALTILLCFFILFSIIRFLPDLPLKKESRPGIADIELSTEQPSLTAANGEFSITLTEKEIKELFDRAKKYLLQFRDNFALIDINRIIQSNASAYVKEKARLLKTFVQKPDFTTIKDTFSLPEVLEDPLLYDGCYVVWAGKAANIKIGTETIRFDLLVGYQHEKELLGVMPVILDFAFNLENGSAVEVLGRIEIKENSMTLNGVSIHRLLED